MKTILIYGDSNTWGYIPGDSGKRYDHKTRWTMALKKLLNEGCPPEDPAYWIEEEGQNGRTTCREDPVEGDKNGYRQLPPILESHKPLDIVIIALGTNDLKARFNPTAEDVAKGVLRLVETAQTSKTGPGDSAPKALIICPPPVIGNPDNPIFKSMFAGGEKISQELPPYFEQAAKECRATLLKAGDFIKSSSVDGIHFDAGELTKLARAVADVIKKL
ncbi:MAG: SGNH/GDSL hydrolase family protein [Treponema sp.]|jgi:lysophospholipase L1-like esterase|nr:SGNH/GDSL hydrolase family protein [Treponema sp.]